MHRESVQQLVDCAREQRHVFGLLRQGEGRVIITANVEDKMQTVRLPQVERTDKLWDFFEILFEELRCEMFYHKEWKIQISLKNENPFTLGKKRQASESGLDEQQKPASPKKLKGSKLKKAKTEAQTSLKALSTTTTTTTTTATAPLSPQKSPSDLSPKTSPSTSTLASSPSQINQLASLRRVPIYHNAHKIYQAQQIAKAKGTTGASAASSGSSSPPQQLPQNPAVQQQLSLQAVKQPSKGSPTEQQSPRSQPPLLESESEIQPALQSPPLPLLQAEALQLAEDELVEMAPPVDPGRDPNDWGVEETIGQIALLDPTLSVHVEAFRSHEIDGKALLLLTSDMLMKYLGLKLGPALKICNIIDKLKVIITIKGLFKAFINPLFLRAKSTYRLVNDQILWHFQIVQFYYSVCTK